MQAFNEALKRTQQQQQQQEQQQPLQSQQQQPGQVQQPRLQPHLQQQQQGAQQQLPGGGLTPAGQRGAPGGLEVVQAQAVQLPPAQVLQVHP
jgi:hypothetical protein